MRLVLPSTTMGNYAVPWLAVRFGVAHVDMWAVKKIVSVECFGGGVMQVLTKSPVQPPHVNSPCTSRISGTTGSIFKDMKREEQ
jgi:hypothetical protein